MDFLIFCILAVRNGVIPSPWNWNAFLKVASRMIGCDFDESDRQKYGNENLFSDFLRGRSLRATAECVYRCNDTVEEVEEVENSDAKEEEDGKQNALAEIGGGDVWLKFHENIRFHRRVYYE